MRATMEGLVAGNTMARRLRRWVLLMRRHDDRPRRDAKALALVDELCRSGRTLYNLAVTLICSASASAVAWFSTTRRVVAPAAGAGLEPTGGTGRFERCHRAGVVGIFAARWRW
jgi:hypothetical protein